MRASVSRSRPFRVVSGWQHALADDRGSWLCRGRSMKTRQSGEWCATTPSVVVGLGVFLRLIVYLSEPRVLDG